VFDDWEITAMGRLALLSVSDKVGLVELATTLIGEFGFELISSGGTAAALKAAGLAVTKVADYTGAPEILGGRVKTLHPRIHGGILARRDVPSDQQELADNQIRPIDLVVVNLYPFEQTIATDNVTLGEAIEQIDIGGPAMLRAAAKNFAHLTVLCSPDQYDPFLEELERLHWRFARLVLSRHLGIRQLMTKRSLPTSPNNQHQTHPQPCYPNFL
jgi:phosphoribosylaminoimidazolecarboxamide formyltransferase / IMP cyclohydrolase